MLIGERVNGGVMDDVPHRTRAPHAQLLACYVVYSREVVRRTIHDNEATFDCLGWPVLKVLTCDDGVDSTWDSATGY